MRAPLEPLQVSCVVGVPMQQTMDLTTCEGVLVQQETNLCCRCCCCMPNINYRMKAVNGDHGYQPGDQVEPTWYLAEDASFFARCISCFCPGAKKTKWSVHAGGSADGPVVMTHEKGWSNSHCPAVCISDGGEIVRCPCCCFLPYLTTKDADGTVLGTTRYICDMWPFVPKFDVFDADDNHLYRVRSDTCCFGCCVRCRMGGQGQQRRGRLRVPHKIREPCHPHNQVSDADITDLWAGVVRQICTKQETFMTKFPPSSGPNSHAERATLVGATLLLNTLMYDHE
eukprot:TRINITY_DN64366_c0_g1_i1.p1 TRINITY_DN64366_c0_g1~~TRINITY_DN64366_c0_g1_i1.p1  ORF type:complete len:313 (+),score=30.75 TRINITY_DN64366_c0_g1_i1:90-941(+)